MPYWDTSCLLKLYVSEPDSAMLSAFVRAHPSVVTSSITRLEMHAAFQRKEAVSDLVPGGARRALGEFDNHVAATRINICPIDSAIGARFDAVIEWCYHQTPPIQLRTLDAVHLATASVLAEAELVATDKRLRDAALALGFRLFPAP